MEGQNFKWQYGLTLIELCITLVLIAVLATSVTPRFTSLVHGTHKREVSNSLHHLFQSARNAAMSRTSVVTICPLSEIPGNCSANWSHPIYAFYDNQNIKRLDNSALVISHMRPAKSGVLTASPPQKGYFQYRPDGTNRGTIGNIAWCPDHLSEGIKGTKMVINMAGRIRHEAASC